MSKSEITEPTGEAEVLAICQTWRPQIHASSYWVELILLAASYSTPVLTWVGWRDWALLGRSGSMMVFFAAIAEFVMLNRMNKKHLINDCRIKQGHRPWDVSRAAAIIGFASLVAALAGTLLWGYADLMANTC
jgi:hypothetical protein